MRRITLVTLVTLIFCLPLWGQSLDEVKEALEDRNIIYAADGETPLQCYAQRPKMAAALGAFITHASIENAVFADWEFTGGSIAARDAFAERAALFTDLFNRVQRLEGLGSDVGSSTCPKRNEIRGAAARLVFIAKEFERQFPNPEEAPVSVVGYIQWKIGRGN